MKHLSDKIFFGVVEDNKDPNRKGRVKVRVQSIFDDIPVEDIPYASPSYSVDGKSFNVPAVGKIVSVVFAWGDIYQPYYVSSNYFNVNLQKKLESLSDDEYSNFSAIVYDHQTQMYVDNSSFVLDFQFNKFKMTDTNINLELKDNKGKINIGTSDADQQALLSNHFFDWFDKFINELIKPSSLLANGSPVIKLQLDIILAEYKAIKETFLSKNVFVVDNYKVNKLERNPKTDTTTSDKNINSNNKDISNVDNGQFSKKLESNKEDEKEKTTNNLLKSSPENSNIGLDIPLNNLIVVYETSTGSPPNSQIVLSSLNVSTENILKKDENNFIEEPGQNPDDLLSGFVTDNSGTIFQEGVNEDLSVVIDENGFSYIEDVSSQISVNDNTTVVRPPSKKPNLGDFFVKNAYGTFIVNPLYGLAGTYLLQFMKELETYLKGKGLILGLASNGITRSIESTLSGGKYRSTTSKHASGLAIDMLIDTVEVNTVSKVSLTSRGYPNGGYNKIGYLEANKILDKIPNLRTYISAFTQSYPGNGGKRFNMIWGGNFGGYNVSEFHHFEISDDSMGQFFEPYKSKLQIANINIPKKQKDLGDVYNLGIV